MLPTTISSAQFYLYAVYQSFRIPRAAFSYQGAVSFITEKPLANPPCFFSIFQFVIQAYSLFLYFMLFLTLVIGSFTRTHHLQKQLRANPAFLVKAALQHSVISLGLQTQMTDLFFFSTNLSEFHQLTAFSNANCQFLRDKYGLWQLNPGENQIQVFQTGIARLYIINCKAVQSQPTQVQLTLRVPKQGFTTSDEMGIFYYFFILSAFGLISHIWPAHYIFQNQLFRWGIRLSLLSLISQISFILIGQFLYQFNFVQLGSVIIFSLAQALFLSPLVLYSFGWRCQFSNKSYEIYSLGLSLLLWVVMVCYEIVDYLVYDSVQVLHKYDSIHGLSHIIFKSTVYLFVLCNCGYRYLRAQQIAKKIYSQVLITAILLLLLGPVLLVLVQKYLDQQYHQRVIGCSEWVSVLVCGWRWRAQLEPFSWLNKFGEGLGNQFVRQFQF